MNARPTTQDPRYMPHAARSIGLIYIAVGFSTTWFPHRRSCLFGVRKSIAPPLSTLLLRFPLPFCLLCLVHWWRTRCSIRDPAIEKRVVLFSRPVFSMVVRTTEDEEGQKEEQQQADNSDNTDETRHFASPRTPTEDVEEANEEQQHTASTSEPRKSILSKEISLGKWARRR